MAAVSGPSGVADTSGVADAIDMAVANGVAGPSDGDGVTAVVECDAGVVHTGSLMPYSPTPRMVAVSTDAATDDFIASDSGAPDLVPTFYDEL